VLDAHRYMVISSDHFFIIIRIVLYYNHYQNRYISPIGIMKISLHEFDKRYFLFE
jgi:hypothetical protein